MLVLDPTTHDAVSTTASPATVPDSPERRPGLAVALLDALLAARPGRGD